MSYGSYTGGGGALGEQDLHNAFLKLHNGS
jgi:hypothetical protein